MLLSLLFVLLCIPLLSLGLQKTTQLTQDRQKKKNTFVVAQVLQMTFGVYVCTPLCICVHVLHTDCMLAAGPLQIKPGLLGVHL